MVWPPALIEDLRDLRLPMSTVTLHQAREFIPRIAEVDTALDPRPGALAHLLADLASTHNAATYLLESQPWDLAAVYYDAIDHFGHSFMEYHPPRMPHVTELEFDVYR